MTDRHMGYVVALERDVREDDAESTIAAIRHIKGVLSVKPITTDAGAMVAELRVRTEVYDAVDAALRKAIWGEKN